ncbi:MAG: cysteine hydrolase family protein [Alphaproteobacteria bacterium]|nr:cysteine hydrolase family protein [Alphaproteobacteria bacterium]
MQNDFLDADGYYARRETLEERDDWNDLSMREQSRLLDIGATDRAPCARSESVAHAVANACAAIAPARAADRPIAFVCAVYDRRFDLLPPLLANNSDRLHFPCKPGTWGGAFFGPIAEAAEAIRPASERIFDKHTYDAFTNPALAAFLHEAGVDTLVFCGTETQVCVLASAQHAAMLGFRAIILEDCVWSVDSKKADTALAIFRDAYGCTMSVRDMGPLSSA